MPLCNLSGLKKYFTVCVYSMKSALREPWHFLGLGLLVISCLLIFFHFWSVVNTSVGGPGVDASQMLWYITFNEWVILSIPSIHSDIESELRRGLLTTRLLAPISYVGMKFAEGLGELLLYITFLGVLSFLFVGILLQGFPFSFPMCCAFVALSVVAGVVALIFQIIVGLAAFWWRDIMPFYWIWEKMLFVFGGLFFPLSIYPAWLRTVAYLTPFSAVLGIRSALVFDFSARSFAIALTLLLLWGVLGTVAVVLLFRRAERLFVSGKKSYA